MKCSDIKNTLENYYITPNNLWVAFYAMSDAVRQFGASPIEYNFCLADTAKQIYDSNPKGVYGCANLIDMQKALQRLETTPLLIADTVLFGIWKAEVFIVATECGNTLTFHRVQAFTSQKAISHITKLYPQTNIVATGSQHDFDHLIQQMENICKTQMFAKISHDRRPIIDGLPSYKLLLCKINPKAFSNAFFDELHPEHL